MTTPETTTPETTTPETTTPETTTPETTTLETGFVVHGTERRPLTVGRTLFDEADDLAVVVPASCRRTGRCHECIVHVDSGGDALSPPAPEESFLRPPYRLACCARVERDTGTIEFTVLRRRLRILMPPAGPPPDVDPLVTRRGREVLVEGELLDADDLPLLGLALDVGTTTVVLDLVDLETGRSVAIGAFENPQRFGGSDVLTRIAYDATQPGELRRSLRRALNDELRTIYREHGIDRHAVREVVAVGNPTMRDLLFDLDVAGLGHQPFRSLAEAAVRNGSAPTTTLIRRAHELGILVHPRARIIGGPLIACHVGADAAADLVAVGLAHTVAGVEGEVPEVTATRDRPRITIVVDIGTNTEVVATDGRRVIAASCPAGPAFEGGDVRYGMPGSEGAIESVRLCNGQLSYNTIGDVEPEGICGSGLVDLLAELRQAGRMTATGAFDDGSHVFDVVPDRGITFSRADVSALAQAKAANSAGIGILLRTLGGTSDDIVALHLAGGFANSLDIDNAIAIGLLPPVPAERVHRAGNASVRGARALLVSGRSRRSLEDLVARIDHIELEAEPDFFETFVDGCRFEPLRPLELHESAEPLPHREPTVSATPSPGASVA